MFRPVMLSTIICLMPLCVGSVSGGSMKELPQWTTGPRLLRLGESIAFDFTSASAGFDSAQPADTLTIYPRYLETANPGKDFKADGGLKWVEKQQGEVVPLRFSSGKCHIEYRPTEAGSYLAKWEVGGETLYRYFSAITDDYVVLRYSSFEELDVDATLHATGIPLDWRLPIARFDESDPLFAKLLGYHRTYGDCIMPEFPDTPKLSAEARVEAYRPGLEKARSLLPDPSDCRGARLDRAMSNIDKGYTETFARLGINAYGGHWCANDAPWLGMPEFPFFASPVDYRKTNQAEGGKVVAHQWDFCGGWHFLGPPSIHYQVSEDNWALTRKCLEEGIDELSHAAKLSGHPIFDMPLYDGILPSRDLGRGPEPMRKFVEKFQRFVAFELPKRRKTVYARSIDVADYYRRHFKATPRTVFSSSTKRLHYDMWWHQDWDVFHHLITVESLPWQTRMSEVMRLREAGHRFKQPLSQEYLLVEDQKRQLRFERECPNPIWWFDYAVQETSAEGSSITHVRIPDVEVIRTQKYIKGRGLEITLKMQTTATIKDYVICLWGLPTRYPMEPGDIQTNATGTQPAANTSGETHLVVFFDLRPDAEITVLLRKPTAKVWKLKAEWE